MKNSIDANATQSTMMERLLNMKETAEYLGVSVATVRKLVRSQDFPACRIGKHWRIEPATLREWVRKQR